ncbi:hypothetical protein GOODEAATRI_025028, partial [Goodea atripinnis]
VGFLILGVGLLDFCGQVCFTPLEALLSDLYREEEDCSQAFAMFSFMVSMGGCVGYLLPAVDWSHSLLSVYLGGQAECLFSLLILIFVTSVIITMKVSEETSCASSSPTGSGSFLESSAGMMEAGRCGLPRSCFYLLRCKLRLLKAGPLLCLLRTCWTMTPAIFWTYCHIPRVMRQLCMAQLCSWMAVMSFMLFYTDFVGEGLYDGVPSAMSQCCTSSDTDFILVSGIRIGSLGLFLQCATSTFFSLVMSRLVRRFGSRWVYLSSMVYMPKGITKSMHTNGMTYLSPAQEEEGVQNHKTAPYKHPLLSQDGYEYFPIQQSPNGSLHCSGGPEQDEAEPGYEKRGVGLDFAILDSTFLLSQVIPTLFVGTIVQFAQSVTAYIASSAIFGAVAIYLASHIVFDQKDLRS